MHLPDGVLPATEWLPLMAVGATVFAAASTRVGRLVDPRRIPAVGFLAAVVLVLQLVNFPLLGGASGHLTGTTLLVFVAGIEATAVAMASVLVLQALLFQDGGVLTLGANYVNIVVVPGLVAAAFLPFARRSSGTRLAAIAGVAAWCGTVAGAVSCAAQLGVAGVAPLRTAATWMGGGHALIGLIEGGLTAATVTALARRRLFIHGRGEVYGNAPSSRRGWFVPVLALAAVASVLVPLASERPDVLEALLRDAASVGTAR